ncbi:MAG: hypothetical protein VX498_10405, partial [Myxococcota bacterium]|nr:hypothetical protein [Myxococcota bacterium]
QFEDQLGSVELTVFPRTYEASEFLLNQPDEPLLLTAKLDEVTADGQVKLIAESIASLADVREELTREVRFELRADEVSSEKLHALKTIFERHPGKARPTLEVTTDEEVKVLMALPEEWTIAPTRGVVEATEGIFGRRTARFRQTPI